MTRIDDTYERARLAFSWERFNRENFDWVPAQRFNISHEVDRHASDPKKVAIFHIAPDGSEQKYTYRELRHLTSKFANVLRNVGIGIGDRVAVMLSRRIECYVAFLAVWKAGAIEVPIFTAFGPEAVEFRVMDCGAKAIVVDADNRAKLDRVAQALPSLQIIVVGGERGLGIRRGDLSFYQELTEASPQFETVETGFHDTAVAQYTSGTTGSPKGTTIPHGGIISEVHYARGVLDVTEHDTFWGFMDPGWAHGLIAAGITLLVLGRSLMVYGGRLTPRRWYEVMESYEVTVFTAAPTFYRMIMTAREELRKGRRLNVRRFVSVGEPLNPDCSSWFDSCFGVPVVDCYGLTEAGMVCVNYPFMSLKPGSMGRPIFGSDVAVMDENGHQLPSGETGLICVKKNDYFHANNYLGKTEQWEARFIDGQWFNTGDLATVDKDGYFFFKGRADDLISASGYRIGPSEVEGALMAHPAVAEAAVVGTHDPQHQETIKAFVVLKPDFSPSDATAKELQEFVRARYSKVAYPRQIQFTTSLPKTESGKIKRHELREA
jgi:acetyl-CoA synthetase